MGCASSVYAVGGRKKLTVPEVVVLVPSTRIPAQSDLQRRLRGLIPIDLAHRLSSLRNQIVLVAEDTGQRSLPSTHHSLSSVCLVAGEMYQRKLVLRILGLAHKYLELIVQMLTWLSPPVFSATKRLFSFLFRVSSSKLELFVCIGGSAIPELRRALEEYLSVLIGLTKKGLKET